MRPAFRRVAVLAILVTPALLLGQSNIAHLMQQEGNPSRGKSAASAPKKASVAQSAKMPATKLDPQTAAAVKAVSPEQLRKTIEKLVSFGTRNTLSANVP